MTDASPTAELPDADDTPPRDGVDLNRTPLPADPFNLDPPDPNNPHLDGGQVLYHMALGAKPEDFHLALQPLARGYSIAFQSPPPKGPGLLGSLDDVEEAIAAAPPAESERAPGDGGSVDSGAENPEPSIDEVAANLSGRDRSYLDRYYDAVAKYANQHRVNPAFPLGLGIESAFGSGGTYLRTGDAFGMTGGSTAQMTHAASPEENARQLFDLYGRQMYGVADDAEAFVNAMQGRNPKGQPVPGWRVYNSKNPNWESMARSGISQMRRDLPIYLPTRPPNAKVGS